MGGQGRRTEGAGVSRGFTVVELLFTVAIIGIISGILTTGLVAARKQASVRNAAHELASHLREASVSTQNGLERALCRVSKPAGLTDEQKKAEWDSRCVRYAITFQLASYTIITWNNPTFFLGDQTFTPPADVLMATSPAGVVAFQYDPPLIKAGMVTPITTTVGGVTYTYYDNFAESDVEILVSHAANPEYKASVCVSSTGAVTVSGSPC